MKSSFSFTATIWKWPGQAGPKSAKATMGAWHFVHLPREYFEPIRAKYGKGMIKVSVTISKTSPSAKRFGGTQWDTSLFPLVKDRSLMICIKAKVRKAEDLMAGDEVKVRVKIK
jgi:hypothetical protein